MSARRRGGELWLPLSLLRRASVAEETESGSVRHDHGLSAMSTAARVNGNFAQALGTLSCRRVGRGRFAPHAGNQHVDGRDHKKVNGGRDQKERDDSIDEVAYGKGAPINGETDS